MSYVIVIFGLCLFQKIHLHLTRPLIRKCMSDLDYAKKYLTRSKVGYSTYPNFGVKFKNSFFPFMTKCWNDLDVSTQIMQLSDFKIQLKNAGHNMAIVGEQYNVDAHAKIPGLFLNYVAFSPAYGRLES